MSRKSTQVALGGMFSALCVSLMFMTGLIPFGTYAIPMLAGAMLIPVVVELGKKAAVMVYVSVGILSIFVAADKEAAMMFLVFFGYYPILKQPLECLPNRVLEYLMKFLVFNASVVGGFAFVFYVLGMQEILEGLEDFGRYTAAILLAFGNVVFYLYDVALTRYYTLYVWWFRPRILRR